MTIEGETKRPKTTEKGFIAWVDRNERRLNLLINATIAISNLISIILLVLHLKK